MRFKPYPKYKPSGVEWLGDVPAGWDVVRNKVFLTPVDSQVGNLWEKTQLLSLTLKGIVLRDIDSGEGKYPSDFSTYQLVSNGDLVFCLFDMDETPRTVGLSTLEGMITGAYTVFRCKPKAIPKYVYSYYLHLDSFKGLRPFYTGLRKVVRPSTFMSVKIALPPPEEQKAISSFLDRETAKIDTLIAKQEKLIELLKEKRQAIISHAVTKGLNPNVKMKDSGIEWLGEVPEHWRLKSIKHLLKRDGYKAGPFGSSLITSALLEQGEVLVLTPENISNRSTELASNQYLPSERKTELAQFRVQVGDVVLPIVGSLGKAMIIEQPVQAILNQRLARISPDEKVLRPEYLLLLLTEYEYFKRLDEVDSKGAILNHITKERLLNRQFALPEITEQMSILNELAQITTKIDTLITKAEQAITLQKEHRTTLISAAVTGKIDVREAA